MRKGGKRFLMHRRWFEANTRSKGMCRSFLYCISSGFLIPIVIGMTVAATGAAATVRNVPEAYPLIQEAIDAAAPGDIIAIAAGIYNERLLITKSITLIGSGSATCILYFYNDLDDTPLVTIAGTDEIDVKIIGMEINGGDYLYGNFSWDSPKGIFAEDATLLLQDIVLNQIRNHMIWVTRCSVQANKVTLQSRDYFLYQCDVGFTVDNSTVTIEGLFQDSGWIDHTLESYWDAEGPSTIVVKASRIRLSALFWGDCIRVYKNTVLWVSDCFFYRPPGGEPPTTLRLNGIGFNANAISSIVRRNTFQGLPEGIVVCGGAPLFNKIILEDNLFLTCERAAIGVDTMQVEEVDLGGGALNGTGHNVFIGSQLHDVEMNVNSSATIHAQHNTWSNPDPGAVIWDVHDNPALGEVVYDPPAEGNAAPAGSLRIHEDAQYTPSVHVSLTLVAVYLGGIFSGKMRFSNDGEAWEPAEWADAPAFAATYPWALQEGPDGLRSVFVQYQDYLGNVSPATISDTILLDATPPKGSVLINDGASYCQSRIVLLTLSADDGTGSGVEAMRFCTDRGSWSDWEPFNSTRVWGLTTGDGVKIVFASFRDAAGGVSSETISDSIILDTTAPAVTVNQAATQPDPAQVAPIHFTVVFSEAIDPQTFVPADLSVTGSAGGDKTVNLTTEDAVTWNAAVNGMTTPGTVLVTLGPDRTQDVAGNGNLASTSADNSVLWDTTQPEEGEGETEGEIEGEGGDIAHPGDLNADWRMVMSEAIAYLAGWQQGDNPIGYAIRAAYLWQNGERYVYDPAQDPPVCWALFVQPSPPELVDPPASTLQMKSS